MSDSYDWEKEDKSVMEDLESPVTVADLKTLVTLRRQRDRAKADADSAEAEYRETEAYIWEKMDNNGDQSIKKDLGDLGIVSIQRRGTVYARVIDSDVLTSELDNLGRAEEMTKAAFEKRRLNEYVRECLEQGIPLPEGLDFYEKRYVAIKQES